MAIRAPIDHVIDYGVQIELLAIQFTEYARQVFRLHQLELMTDRRDHPLVLFAHLFDKVAIALFDFLFYDATPAQPVIR